MLEIQTRLVKTRTAHIIQLKLNNWNNCIFLQYILRGTYGPRFTLSHADHSKSIVINNRTIERFRKEELPHFRYDFSAESLAFEIFYGQTFIYLIL
jgi:hypothetical protein